MERKLKRKVSDFEVGKELNWSNKLLTNIILYQNDISSLNTSVNEDGEDEQIDYVADQNKSVEDEVMGTELVTDVANFLKLSNLTEREKKVISYKYGFHDMDQKPTNENIGKILNIGGERVRQIEARAFTKMIRSRYVLDLAIYMNNPEQAKENIYQYRKLYRNDSNKYKKPDSKLIDK